MLVVSWTLLQDVSHTRAGFWAAPNSFSPQMKNSVVQTSLPGLARNLEGLQKMQVSGGVGNGGAFSAHGVVLTLLCPTEEQHSCRAARSRGTGTVAHAELHSAVTRGFGGEFMLGWWQWCHWHLLEGDSKVSEPFSPPCPAGKAGGKRPVPLPLGTTSQGIHASLPTPQKLWCPMGPICQKKTFQGDGGARKNASQENQSPLVIRFAVANQKSPCKGVFLLRAHPSFPALQQPDSIWSSALLPAPPGDPSHCCGP